QGFNLLSKQEISELTELLDVQVMKSGNLLVKEGIECNKCYFVLKGCLRQYQVLEGQEKTIEFYTENQAVNYFTGFTGNSAAENNLICIEDSVLLIGSPAEDIEKYKKYPALEQITRSMLEKQLRSTQENFARFRISSPEDRYLHFLESRPGLALRVPQHQLASYLGVTPESLSRIRSRIRKQSD